MGNRKWKYYIEPNTDGIKLGKFASSAYASRLARSCNANYAQCRRNVLCFTTNVDSNLIVPAPYIAGEWTRWLKVPIGPRITIPGTLKVCIFAKTPASENAANNIHCQVKVGPDYTQGTLTLDASDPAWTTFTVNLTGFGYDVINRDLEIGFRTIGTNTLTIYAVSAYMIGDSNAPNFTDISSGMVGSNYGPDDVFAMKLLRDNVCAVRGWKVPKANVFNHWYERGTRAASSYSTNNDALGHYKFVKRKGISELQMHMLCARDGSATSKIRTEITGLDNAPAEGAAQETTVTTASTGAPGWYTVTWTIHADDVDDEFECGLLIDGKDSGTPSAVYMAGFSLVETEPSSSHAHTCPDVLDVGVNDPIEADHHEEVWDTCHHLYYYGGRQILVADWYHHDYTGGVYSSQMVCDQTSFDKRSWYGWGVTPSVIARALLYSSTASQRLQCRMGFYTDTYRNTGSTKTIHLCTTETIDNVHCTHIDGNPLFEGDDDNDYAFVHSVDGADGNPAQEVAGCFFEIRSADQEEHYDGVNEPPQICLQGITSSSADEYVVPQWISVEEYQLAESEFP